MVLNEIFHNEFIFVLHKGSKRAALLGGVLRFKIEDAMSRNAVLGIAVFGSVSLTGAATYLVSGNAATGIICAVGLATGLILFFGRKWYRVILRDSEQKSG